MGRKCLWALVMAVLLSWGLSGCAEEEPPEAASPEETASGEAGAMWLVYEEGGNYGYRDSGGQVRVPARYDEVTPPGEDGVGYVRSGFRWGHVTTWGTVVEPFAEARYCLAGGEALVQVGGLYTILTVEGERRTEPAELVQVAELDGTAAYELGGRSVIPTRDGVAVLPEEIRIMEAGPAYFITMNRENRLRGAVSCTGETLLEPVYWKICEGDREGMARVIYRGPDGGGGFRDGYIGPDASVIIPAEYESLSPFSRGLTVARLGGAAGKCGALNRAGEVVIPFEYSSLAVAGENLILAHRDGRAGYLNFNNETVLPFDYDSATLVLEGGVIPLSPHSKSLYLDPGRPREYREPDLTLVQSRYITLDGGVFYETPIFAFPKDRYLDFRIFSAPGYDQPIPEGCYVRYDVSGVESTSLDINGYYGELGDAGWDMLTGHPVYEVVLWEEGIEDLVSVEYVPYP